jgi:hypothetical protein
MAQRHASETVHARGSRGCCVLAVPGRAGDVCRAARSVAFGRRRFSPPGFRTAIASLNRRSIVLYRSCPRECLTGQWNGSEWS